MAGKHPQKLVRRLAAAEGYLELGMPQHALDELATESDFGTLAAPADYLRGMAFKAQENYGDAIPAFQRAARLIPVPYSQPVWRQLVECLRQQGQEAMAELAETFAEAPAPVMTFAPVINIEIHLSSESDDLSSENDAEGVESGEAFDHEDFETDEDREGESWKDGVSESDE